MWTQTRVVKQKKRGAHSIAMRLMNIYGLSHVMSQHLLKVDSQDSLRGVIVRAISTAPMRTDMGNANTKPSAYDLSQISNLSAVNYN